MSAHHEPVLLEAVLAALRPRPGGRYVDATVGLGGHAAALLTHSAPDGQLLGLDVDPEALALARERLAPFGDRVRLVHASYARLAEVVRAQGWYGRVDGLLLDLGVSSLQLDRAARGFSFRQDAPLDMRFDPTAGGPTAADLVNTLPEDDLAALLWRYGEERRARAVARAIVQHRPITTTAQLARVVAQATRSGRKGMHPATRTFQALRIAVNRELANVERVLPQAIEVLAPGGRLAIIAFHSLEDRIVKHFLQRESRDCVCPPEQPVCTCGHRAQVRLVRPFPVRPTADEVARNPRARSARLRVAEKRPPEVTV